MKRLNPGDEIDGFEIEACVHAGGMAHIYKVVYAAAEDGTRRPSEFPMAMKIPRMTAGDGAENIISFEVELQILGELKGPHVPRFVAAGDLLRVPYLVMEYVEGHTLQHWLDRRDTLTVSEMAALGAAMARAAHSLHQQNVCHLDLKPANILIRPDGAAVMLDEEHRGRTPGQCLEAECAGSGVEVRDADAVEVQPRGEHVEHRLAYPVGGGTGALRRYRQPPATGRAGDDPGHGARGSAITLR